MMTNKIIFSFLLLIISFVKVSAQTPALPDNIIVNPDDCVIPFTPIQFKVKQKWQSDDNTAYNMAGVLVGDLDGDGISEMVTYSNSFDKMNVFDGSTGVLKTSITIPKMAAATGGWHPVVTAVIVDSDRNRFGEIIVCRYDNKIMSYEAYFDVNGKFALKEKWATLATYENPSTVDMYPHPNICDLNGDGIPELIVYNKIYNAVTGAYLGQTEAIATAYVGRVPSRGGNMNSNFQTTADIDGDGLPEIVAGGKVYKATFNPAKTAVTFTAIYNNTKVTDGFTAVADVDLDGVLDVVVVNVVNSQTWVHVWTPKAGMPIIQSFKVYDQIYQSFPFVGDIDGVTDATTGKKYPEICVVIINKVMAYKYNSTTKTYSEKWTLPTTDSSGGTGITLFDFNNDGINELVYRDQTVLRILNGTADNVPPGLADAGASFPCTSGTAFEYPVIADVDGDGSANICVTGGTSVHVYESATQPWAPTRKVWSQVNYEPTQINNDLTVPTRSIPKNREFIASSQKYRPYNGALIQVPIVDLNMIPVVEAPDPFVKSIEAVRLDNGQIKIIVNVANRGAKHVNSSLPITLYHTSILSVNKIETKQLNVTLPPAGEVSIEFTLPSTTINHTYIARLQDDGAVYPALGSYFDCNMDNNTFSASGVFANDDYFLAFSNIDNDLSVLTNDVLSSLCTSPQITITENPLHGSVVISGNVVKYKSTTNYIGNDSFTYTLTCGTATSSAKVSLNVVPKPDNISDATCWLSPDAKEWTMTEAKFFDGTTIPNWQSVIPNKVNSMSTPLVADMDGDGIPEIIVPILSRTAVSDPWQSDGLLIANVKNNTERVITTTMFRTHGQSIAIADVDKDGKSEIFMQGSDGKIYCYNYLGVAKSGFTTTKVLTAHNIVQIADINNDGNPELIAGGYIFNAKTGTLLLEFTPSADGTAYGNPHLQPLTLLGAYYMPAIGDIDGDGDLEIVAGSTVYDIYIAPNSNTTAGNSLIKRTKVDITGQPAAFKGYLDGATVLVDFDLDGQLDVAVIASKNQGTAAVNGQFYVWNPITKKVIAYGPELPAASHTIPYVADLDGNGYPDFAFATGSATLGMVSYQYDSSLPGNVKPGLTKSEFAETSGFTIFDFNQDGKSEIVYRGNKQFYIVDGKTLNNLSTPITAYSGTVAEYPIVADVDGDGQAEIILTRSDINWHGGTPQSANATGKVSIYKSADPTQPWAPARKVWNQWAYSAVHINEDMTVPRYQIAPGTAFPGKDGLLKTNDDIRPYNSFLAQQTALNKNGTSLFLTPNAKIIDSDQIKYAYDTESDNMVISDLKISNEGDALLAAPIKITVYKDQVSGASEKFIYDYNESIQIGETKTVSFTVPGFSRFIPVSNLIVRVNDSGNGLNNQPVCDSCCVNNTSGSFANIPFETLAWADTYRKCIGDNVSFTAVILPGTNVSYKWETPSGINFANTRNTTLNNLSLSQGGEYIFKANNINGNLSVKYVLPYLSVAPLKMTWRKDVNSYDWNNLNNWLDGQDNPIKAVPSSCTDVHIPGGAATYPSLDDLSTPIDHYGSPVAKDLILHYGGQISYPHKLTYQKAHIQYNFGYYGGLAGPQPTKNAEGSGTPMLQRDRWYLLSAPLKNVVSGDFTFAGYPITWQSVCHITNPVNSHFETADLSKPYPRNDIPLTQTNNAFALKVAGQENIIGKNNHKHLEALQGILQLPYLEKSNYPGHQYDPLAQISRLFYFNTHTLQQLTSPVGEIKRGPETYRFLHEDPQNNNKPYNITVAGQTTIGYQHPVTTDGPNRKILVGNPFISSLNPWNLYQANQDILENNGYDIYDGQTQQWKNYSFTTTNNIAPLQAFVLTLKPDTPSGTLKYPLEGQYPLTRAGGISAQPLKQGNDLYIKTTLSGQTDNSAPYAVIQSTASTPLTKNVKKLITPQDHAIAEPFLVSPDGKTYNQSQPYHEGQTTITLGIKTSDTNQPHTLTFENIDNFIHQHNVYPVLEDRYLGIRQDITLYPRYTFTQRTVTGDNYYADADRFVLRFYDEPIATSQSEDITITYQQKELKITSTHAIKQVTLYTLLGQTIHHSGTLPAQSTYTYNRHLPLSQGVYIVKVQQTDGKIVTKKITVF